MYLTISEYIQGLLKIPLSGCSNPSSTNDILPAATITMTPDVMPTPSWHMPPLDCDQWTQINDIGLTLCVESLMFLSIDLSNGSAPHRRLAIA